MEYSNTILLASAVIFALASVVFLYLTAKTKNSVYSYAFLVSIITLISSLIMYDGVLIVLSSSNEALYYSRWLGYILSCTLLMYSIAKYVVVPETQLTRLLYLTGITMLTGALASATDGLLMLSYFAVGTVTFILMLLIVTKNASKPIGWIGKYIWFGWCVFPVVFLLSPEGYGIISLGLSVLLYLILDLFSKIAFYFELGQKSKT